MRPQSGAELTDALENQIAEAEPAPELEPEPEDRCRKRSSYIGPEGRAGPTLPDWLIRHGPQRRYIGFTLRWRRCVRTVSPSYGVIGGAVSAKKSISPGRRRLEPGEQRNPSFFPWLGRRQHCASADRVVAGIERLDAIGSVGARTSFVLHLGEGQVKSGERIVIADPVQNPN